MMQNLVACQVDPDMWFSESESKKLLTKELCSNCWFKDHCLSIAITNEEVHGVWGGIDFSRPENRIKPSVKKCWKGLHELPEGGSCAECKREYYRSYSKKTKPWTKRPYKKRPRKHVEGGYCVNGHLLDKANISVRSSDQALLCKKCISGNKRPSARAYIKPGDFSG